MYTYLTLSIVMCLIITAYLAFHAGCDIVSTASDMSHKEDQGCCLSYAERKKIECLLRTHCEEAHLYLNPMLTREMLCRAIGINRNKLMFYFRDANISFYQYINTLRIEYSCHLLADYNANASAKQIARQCGFATYRTFYNYFISIKGCTPSDWRERMSE